MPPPVAAAYENSRSIPAFNLEDLVPVYDSINGLVIGYVSASRTSESVTSKISSQATPVNLPLQSVQPPYSIPPQQTNLSKPPKPDEPVAWDYWPDGIFDRDFTWEEVNATSRLMCHWAVFVGGGDRKGSEHATNWAKGKKATRACLGVILCDNPDCQISLRPHTKSHSLAKQLATSCDCGAERLHQKCSVRSSLWTWSGGIHFRNEGFHSHDRPPRLLHLSNDEKEKFQALVNQHPKTGPLGLIVGVPGIDGPGQSVADISDALLNADRVSKERLKIKHNLTGSGGNADSFITSFSQFDEEHPNFVRLSVLGKVAVISMQTPFMASQLIHDDIDDSPINGLVNDAAHGWWQSNTCLLMVTSTYCPVLHCWVPVLFSYTNGASAMHFKHHFLTLFQSIALQAGSQKIAVTDRLFAGVMDFSEAERNGFIEGFITFWRNRGDNTRSDADLREDASRLLRGCQEHFRAGVTRLSRISGVIPVEKRDAFVQRAVGLLAVPTEEEFSHRAKLILRDFPKTASWLNWWLRPAHAPMLFEAHRKMDITIWDAIPVTTNAEEAMNWKLYAAAGRNHSLMEGLRSLYAVASYYERSYRENLRGVPIRYGRPERWKLVADQIGRTKPTRAPDAAERRRKKNDGRPPDTAKELLDPKKNKKQEEQVQRVMDVLNNQTDKTSKKTNARKKKLDNTTLTPTKIPSYIWNDNSCWLDTSLELLYATVLRDFEEFEQAFQDLSPDSPLQMLHTMMQTRQMLGHDSSKILSNQRNKLRSKIVLAKEAKTMSSYEPLFSWFHGLLGREPVDVSYGFPSYFEMLITEIHSCTGSTNTGGEHLEIRNIPQRPSSIEIGQYGVAYKGDLTAWFTSLMSGRGTKVSNLSCWRTVGEESLCSGVRTDTRGLVMSIPVVLFLRVPEVSNQPVRNVPQTLTPLTKNLANKKGVIYDLVGFGLYSEKACHFTARYTLKNNSDVFSYDGMKNAGYAVWEGQGNQQDFPKGYVINTVVYYLRGGLRAQNVFFLTRKKEYSKRFNINVSGDLSTIPYCSYTGALVELSQEARFWKRPTQHPKTKEYVAELISTHKLITPPFEPRVQVSTPDLNSKASPESEEPMANRSPSPAHSLPDSDFMVNCRCGVNGNGNVLYRTRDEGAAIQCNGCDEWSHMACQRDGRADLLKDKDKFFCDFCDAANLLQPKERESKRILLGSRIRLKKPLNERLVVGRGGLAQIGDYWYPVRLIDHQSAEKMWSVRWWRGCQFEKSNSITPGSITAVSEPDIVDSLWGDRIERRKIRLGKWTHAHEIPSTEDILSDPSFTSYPPEMHAALAPSIRILQALLTNPADVDNIPAKTWLETQGKNIATTIVPFTGNLSVIERAQLGSWFEEHVAMKDKSMRRFWLSLLPFAHTCTLWLVALLHQNKGELQKFDISDNTQVIQAAWELQTTDSPKHNIDVDKECLERLEEEMFERSALAGKAGNLQWGLDAGDHQEGWNPYLGTEQWSYDIQDSSGDDELYENGPNFIVLNKPPPVKRPQPKPRPKKTRGRNIKK